MLTRDEVILAERMAYNRKLILVMIDPATEEIQISGTNKNKIRFLSAWINYLQLRGSH